MKKVNEIIGWNILGINQSEKWVKSGWKLDRKNELRRKQKQTKKKEKKLKTGPKNNSSNS